MKKMLTLALALMMAFNLFGCSQSAPADQPVKQTEPVAYTGEAEGKGGLIKVEVLVNGETIEQINILEHSETAGISDAAFNEIPENIIESQSLAVDGVAGATLTSRGIIGAVGAALDKAGVAVDK